MNGPFTTGEAYEHGYGRGALRGRGGRRELRGVYLPAWIETSLAEYEGDQHRVDRRQRNRDVWRQERLVEDDHTLVRVTAERMRAPRTVVLGVHQALLERGYDGPPPTSPPRGGRSSPLRGSAPDTPSLTC